MQYGLPLTIWLAALIARTTLRGAEAGGIAKPSLSFARAPGAVWPSVGGVVPVPPMPTPPLPAASAVEGRAIRAVAATAPSAAHRPRLRLDSVL